MIFVFLDDIIKMPKIMFEVASYDSWNRYRTEGYTWTQLPLKPGKQQLVILKFSPRISNKTNKIFRNIY